MSFFLVVTSFFPSAQGWSYERAVGQHQVFSDYRTISSDQELSVSYVPPQTRKPSFVFVKRTSRLYKYLGSCLKILYEWYCYKRSMLYNIYNILILSDGLSLLKRTKAGLTSVQVVLRWVCTLEVQCFMNLCDIAAIICILAFGLLYTTLLVY